MKNTNAATNTATITDWIISGPLCSMGQYFHGTEEEVKKECINFDKIVEEDFKQWERSEKFRSYYRGTRLHKAAEKAGVVIVDRKPPFTSDSPHGYWEDTSED